MDGYWIIRRTRQKSGSGRRPADVDVDIYVHDVDVDVEVDVDVVFFLLREVFPKNKMETFNGIFHEGEVHAFHTIWPS